MQDNLVACYIKLVKVYFEIVFSYIKTYYLNNNCIPIYNGLSY